MQDRCFNNYDPDKDESEEKKTKVDEDKLSHAISRVGEINRLKTDNNEFVRGLIPVLTLN